MAPVPYATRDQVKIQLSIPLEDTTDDDLIDRVLAATTIGINTRCLGAPNRSFHADTVATARVYMPRDPSLLPVDAIADSGSISCMMGVAPSFTDPIGADQYEALPLNATADGLAVDTLRHYWAFWPLWPSARVQVTAKWGWPVVPDGVPLGQTLWSAKLFDRRNSPNGVAGQGDFGPIRVGRWDADVEVLLGPYTNPGFA